MRGWIVILGLLGCAKPAPSPAAVEEVAAPEPVAQPAPMQPEADDGLAPHPYTADQIRESWVPGLVVTWRVTGEGGAVSWQRWEVRAADADTVTLAYMDADESGAATGEAETASNTWVELREHASFPAAHTTVEEVEIETPFGTRRAQQYTVAEPEAEGTVRRYWFGVDTAGAPLRHTVTVGEEVVMEMSMTSRGVPQ